MGDLTRKLFSHFSNWVKSFYTFELILKEPFEKDYYYKLSTLSPSPSTTMNLSSAWSNYLKLDLLAPEINANGSLMAVAIRETETYKTFLPLLTGHKSLTMISKPTIGTEAQVTTFHTYYPTLTMAKRRKVTCQLKRRFSLQ